MQNDRLEPPNFVLGNIQQGRECLTVSGSGSVRRQDQDQQAEVHEHSHTYN